MSSVAARTGKGNSRGSAVDRIGIGRLQGVIMKLPDVEDTGKRRDGRQLRRINGHDYGIVRLGQPADFAAAKIAHLRHKRILLLPQLRNILTLLSCAQVAAKLLRVFSSCPRQRWIRQSNCYLYICSQTEDLRTLVCLKGAAG